jgi:hypothetical protein
MLLHPSAPPCFQIIRRSGHHVLGHVRWVFDLQLMFCVRKIISNIFYSSCGLCPTETSGQIPLPSHWICRRQWIRWVGCGGR